MRILLFEDNPADAELIQYELREALSDFVLIWVKTKEAFLKELLESPPDLILSDYDLPRYNGALALAEARKRCPDVPFILVTGAVSEDRAIEILTSGARDYVLKHRLNRLVPAVQRALAEADEHKERMKASEKLHAASLYSRSLIEASLDPLVTISPEGKVMDVNKATEEITGVSRDRIIGSDFSDYFTQPKQARQGYKRAFSEGSVKDYPLAIRHISGRVTQVLYNAATYRDEKGEIQGVFAAARDITELSKAEAELREAHKTLEERIKLRTAEMEAEMAERKRMENHLAADLTALTRMHELSIKSLETGGLEPLLQEIMDTAVVIVAADKGTLQLVEGDSLRIVAHHGHDRSFLNFFASAENVASVCGAATKRAERVIVTDVESSPLLAGTPSLSILRNASVRAVQSTPLFSRRGELLGILTTQWSVPHVPDEHALWRIDLLARQASDMIEHARAEEAVSRSQKTFFELVERSPFGTYIVDSQFRIAQMNTASQDGAFRNVRPLIGRSFNEAMHILWPEPVAAEIISHFRHTLETGEPYYSPRFVNPRHDVDVVEAYEWELHRMLLPDGQYGVICYYFDSTKLREAEEALRRQREWLRVTLASIGDAVISTDSTGRVTFMNPVAEKLTGWFIHGASGRPLSEVFNIINEHTRQPVESPVTRVLKEGMIVGLANHTILVRKDGTEVPIDDSGAPIKEADGKTVGVVLVFRDITKRKKEEAELARLASFPLLNPNPVMEVDLAGVLQFCNPAAERLFPDLCQRGLEHPLIADLEAFVHSFRKDGFEEGTREVNVEGLWYLETMHFVAEQNRIRIYMRDITLRKGAEEELMERAAQLEDANKELESFNYTVSHDLQAPLRAIKGFSEMILKDEAGAGAETRRKLAVIQGNAAKMQRLIEDLLSLSRIGRQKLSLTSIDMDALVRDAWKELEAAYPEKSLKLKTKELRPAYGDQGLIRQVLVNLLSNAIKFSANRKPIAVEVGGRQENGGNVYYVKDKGVGFDMKYYDKLFGVFQRLHSDAEFQGTGIGLSIAQRIVHLHGGHIWAEGKVGKGATFYFLLPEDKNRKRAHK